LNAAEQHLQALQKKGLIDLLAGTSRGIRLREERVLDALDNTARTFAESAGFVLPLIGKVAAGSPILALENILRTPAIDPSTFKPRADYLLEVRGMSMRDAGILDGDWLAVHRQVEARSGQIVVARLGDEVTVKRLKRKGNRIELLAENPDFNPIVVTEPAAFAIEGLAVGVIRATV
jgi:repressor LexA